MTVAMRSRVLAGFGAAIVLLALFGAVAFRSASWTRRRRTPSSAPAGVVVASLLAMLAVGAGIASIFHGLASLERATTRVRELAEEHQDLYDHSPRRRGRRSIATSPRHRRAARSTASSTRCAARTGRPCRSS